MNRIRLSILISFCVTTGLASAASPDASIVDLPKNMEFAADFTLLQKSGSKPVHAPMKDGQSVLLKFDQVAKDTPSTVRCTLNIPKKLTQIAPGESAVIGIKCSEVVNLPRSKLGFTVIDGDLTIGSGAFRP